jgi:Clostripain family
MRAEPVEIKMRIFTKASTIIFALALLVSPAWADADWTVMIYLNAKNNLEQDGINNFQDMAATGSSPNVNLVVEMGRPLDHISQDFGPWSGVLRFLVRKGTHPTPSEALMDLSKSGENTDMGSPETLSNFIDWSLKNYPAKHYMLVIWNHGQGWRFQIATALNVRTLAAKKDAMSVAMVDQMKPRVPPVGGYRSVSWDDDTKNILYNSQIQTVLSQKFSNPKLDVLGFDACLMAMIETGYAFTNSVELMVGSEELEPGDGWAYRDVIGKIVSNPKWDANALGNAVVDGYRRQYQDRQLTTMSLLDLSKVDDLSKSVSSLALKITDNLNKEKSALGIARTKVQPYGKEAGLRYSIDLSNFLDEYAKATSDANVKAAISAAKAKLTPAILANYASKKSQGPFGSQGLAIYFPATTQDFMADYDHAGYLKDNTNYPVAFVQKEKWADFLKAYLGL